MTTPERIRAFSLRCSGATWEEIGAVLHYDPRTVARDLRGVLEKHPKQPAILYPAIRQYIRARFAGSIESFAREIHVSPHRLRRALLEGDAPEGLRRKIVAALGITEPEAFAPERREE